MPAPEMPQYAPARIIAEKVHAYLVRWFPLGMARPENRDRRDNIAIRIPFRRPAGTTTYGAYDWEPIPDRAPWNYTESVVTQSLIYIEPNLWNTTFAWQGRERVTWQFSLVDEVGRFDTCPSFVPGSLRTIDPDTNKWRYHIRPCITAPLLHLGLQQHPLEGRPRARE